jgi:L-2-hydroxycarboxylate dehydrogenase (NAD+)
MTKKNRLTIKIHHKNLFSIARRLLIAASAEMANAETVADNFVEADCKGVGIQGADSFCYVIDCLKRGIIDGKAKPSLVKETSSTALIDGNRRLGQLAASIAGKKAKQIGCATVAVRNSTDIFMIGAYTLVMSTMKYQRN